jgi:hypothetical protein
MKMTFLVCNAYFEDRVLQLLAGCGIDYYSSWEPVKGRGRGTEPHLGSAPFGSTNVLFMIAFQEDAPLENLIRAVGAANQEIKRPSDRIRLFQLPLERIV